MTIHERHLELVRAVNDSRTERQHERAGSYLDGFCEALRRIGVETGEMIMAADLYYIDQGIDRPMCGGVFLDWKEPTK